MRLALLAVVAGAVLAVPATPVQAAPAQASGCSGVTVVVDFASLGGGDQSRCAPGDPDSGVAALRGAGFAPTRAAQESGYFVCRIDGKPANDPCQRASPEDAYWSYWRAKPGGSWSFSNEGAGTSDPKPGDVEGWAFGDGDPPSTPPPAPAAASPPAARPSPERRRPPPSAQAPSPRPRRLHRARRPVRRCIGGAGRECPPVHGGPGTPSAPPDADAARHAPRAGAGRSRRRCRRRPASDDGGSPLAGVLLALAVVAGLGAAAASRRRSADEPARAAAARPAPDGLVGLGAGHGDGGEPHHQPAAHRRARRGRRLRGRRPPRRRPWARAFKAYLVLGLVVVLVRVVFNVLLGAGIDGHVLFTLRGSACRLGGGHRPRRPGARRGGAGGGVRRPAPGRADRLRRRRQRAGQPQARAAALPPALYEVGVAVVVALTIAPQLVESVLRCGERGACAASARGLRAIRAIALPGARGRAVALAHAGRRHGLARLRAGR
jgi:hypothetical protein